MTEPQLSATRRTALRTGGLLAAGAFTAGVAGCSSDEDSTSSPTVGSSTTSSEPTSPSPVAASPVGAATEVPVGEAKIFPKAKVVVTQPTAGTFKAFSAVCTHSGCLVSKVSGQSVECRCHGSAFSLADGSVQGGPAPSPLAARAVTVTDGQLSVN